MTKLPITQLNPPPDLIDLGIGNPDTNLLPLEALQHSAVRFFASGDSRPLQYGIEQGNGYFRLTLAEFLSQAYGKHVDLDSLFITTGASSALDLICSLYTKPGDVIFVEEPTYFLALRIFEDHGLRIISLPMDGDGLLIDQLDKQLKRYRPKFLYSIPVYQNPSGLTLSKERRKKMIALAHENNFLIVADEVYQLLNYSDTPPPAFASFTDEHEWIISINSFSKILAPGLRLGWVQAHPLVVKLLVRCGLLDSGGGMSPYTSVLVHNLIESGGLAKNIAHLRNEYKRRLEAMDAALQRYVPEAEYVLPKGGFFFWVHLSGVNAVDFRKRLKPYDIDIRPGSLFSSRNEMQEYFRMGFTFYPSEKIEEGIKRLGKCKASL